jgi:hypothetical protein
VCLSLGKLLAYDGEQQTLITTQSPSPTIVKGNIKKKPTMSVNIVDVGVSRVRGWLLQPSVCRFYAVANFLRQDQEDRYITLPPGSLKSRKELAVYAVYDGQ